MKPITVWLPDETKCAFIGYVYHENGKLMMGERMIDSDDLKSGESKGEEDGGR